MDPVPVPVKTKDDDAVKLFVGQVPRTATEATLLPVLEEFGPVFELHILRDKMTGTAKGCCFVTFCHRSSADQSMQALHGIRTLPGMSNPMQVRLADSEQEKEEQRRLFVGMLSKTATEEQVRAMFEPYGAVEDMVLLKGPDGTSKGCAFVRYAALPHAMAAIAALHGSITMDGCARPIVVKPADSDKERASRRVDKAGPMGTPYGMGAMFPSSAGYPQMMGQGYGNMGMGLAAAMPGMGAMGPVPGQDMAQYGMQQGGYGYAPNAMGMGMGMGFGGVAPQVVASPTTGPEGANLFIYHLPVEWGDGDLYQAFGAFGAVVSAKVFVEKTTNQSKCFGFVSYQSPASAANAIQHMNGYQMGTKRLKVQLKRSKEAARPY